MVTWFRLTPQGDRYQVRRSVLATRHTARSDVIRTLPWWSIIRSACSLVNERCNYSGD